MAMSAGSRGGSSSAGQAVQIKSTPFTSGAVKTVKKLNDMVDDLKALGSQANGEDSTVDQLDSRVATLEGEVQDLYTNVLPVVTLDTCIAGVPVQLQVNGQYVT